MSTEQIAFTTGRTKRLIKEYEQIIEEYKNVNYNMKQLLASEVHIESNIESWIIGYAEKMPCVLLILNKFMRSCRYPEWGASACPINS